MKVWICLVIMQITVHSSEALFNDTFDAISVDNLRQYTSIVKCLGKIHDRFSQCNSIANETGRQFLQDYEAKSINDLPDYVRCCGLIALTECWLNAAQSKCTLEERQNMSQIPYIIIPQLRNDCKNFVNSPHKCRTTFNLWHILTFLLVIPIVSFAFISMTIICCCRHKYSYLREGMSGCH